MDIFKYIIDKCNANKLNENKQNIVFFIIEVILKGYYSKEKHVAMLTSIMNGKHYNRKANNSKGILPSQMGTIRKSIYKLNPETLAHMIREQEKRIAI